MDGVQIAVIGAGIAGLACARELARADAKVTVFEKSRGLGGRLGTRRQGNFAFDHGAQFGFKSGAVGIRFAAKTMETAVPSTVKARPKPPPIGRNTPCPCGSGKKYKNCHLKSDERGDTQPA